MSKRFGRNQKRKLIQQLAEQKANAERFECAYEMSAGLQRNTSEKLSEVTRRLEMIYSDNANNLNPDHPMLPSSLRGVIKANHDTNSIRVPISDNHLGGHVKVLDLLRREFFTEQFSNMVAVKVMHGHRVVGYAIDLDSLQLMTFREEMVRDLALDIANQLLDAISSGDNQR
jgi:hypothetical protein